MEEIGVPGPIVSLGRNIKRLRTMTGVGTQKALAEKLGIPPPRVSDWENDRYPTLKISSLVKIAKVFRCSVDVLIAGIDTDYDRISGVPATMLPDIAVVAEGDMLPDEVATRNERARGRPKVLRWVSHRR